MEVVLFGTNHASPPATEFQVQSVATSWPSEVTDFERGRWTELLEAASRFNPSSHSRHERTEEEEQMRRAQAAQSRIQRGQCPVRVKS